MTEYWVFQPEQLIATKFLIFGFIHSCLIFIIVEGAIKQHRQTVLLIPINWITLVLPSILGRIAFSFMIGASIAYASSLLGHNVDVGTMMIANAGFLTLWYVECAILLARGFFSRLFGDELPKEITFFVSFIVMINAGYFTLMFMVSILRAPSL